MCRFYNFQVFPDKSVIRELQKQLVYCCYKEYGCKDENITYGLLEQHMRECPYGSVECPNKANGCTARIPRGDLNRHKEECDYVKINCRYCKTAVIGNELKVSILILQFLIVIL